MKLVAKVTRQTVKGKYIYGRILIPIELLEKAGISVGDEVILEIHDDSIVVRKFIPTPRPTRRVRMVV